MTPHNNPDPRRAEILAIIADQANRQATETSTLGSLDMDSLDTVELIFTIEDKFDGDISIDDELWVHDTTAGQIIDDVIGMLDA